MRRELLLTLAVPSVVCAGVSHAADVSLLPGLYQVEVRISLPNLPQAAPPIAVTRCITPDDLRSGQAFSILSDNPLKQCELVDYQTTPASALYRIICEGPNRGSALGTFDIKANTYRGTITMNMGGKNMTMSETQAGKKIGDCR